ncbi:conserved protein, unknown function [Plasmodium sp. gorilla clade G1]|nr:conserved protein, unknown function [Plasmodium sp. gorilla clade G1]
MYDKKYDILLLGCTGYTGQMVLEYFLENYEKKIKSEEIKLLCGVRNIKKLDTFLYTIKEKNDVILKKINKKEIDINIYESILNCCKISKVVISTIGPYILYGYNIVKACVEGGCHYVDVCGEHNFILNIYKEFNNIAIEKKLKIIHSASFISAISDIGNFIMQEEFFRQYKKTCPVIKIRLCNEGNNLRTIGKTTIKSALLFKKYIKNNYHKYYLRDNKYDVHHNVSGNNYLKKPKEIHTNSFLDYEKEFGYCFDTSYSNIEEAYVLWSNYLLNYKYGKDLVINYKQYDTHLSTSMYIFKKVCGKIFNFFQSFFFMDYLINKYIDLFYKPKTMNELKKAYWKCIIVGEDNDNDEEKKKKSIYLYLSGKNEDPGYLLSAKIISESAISLLKENDLPKTFGVISVSVGLGNVLVERLKKASIHMSIEK